MGDWVSCAKKKEDLLAMADKIKGSEDFISTLQNFRSLEAKTSKIDDDEKLFSSFDNLNSEDEIVNCIEDAKNKPKWEGVILVGPLWSTTSIPNEEIQRTDSHFHVPLSNASSDEFKVKWNKNNKNMSCTSNFDPSFEIAREFKEHKEEIIERLKTASQHALSDQGEGDCSSDNLSKFSSGVNGEITRDRTAKTTGLVDGFYSQMCLLSPQVKTVMKDNKYLGTPSKVPRRNWKRRKTTTEQVWSHVMEALNESN